MDIENIMELIRNKPRISSIYHRTSFQIMLKGARKGKVVILDAGRDAGGLRYACNILVDGIEHRGQNAPTINLAIQNAPWDSI